MCWGTAWYGEAWLGFYIHMVGRVGVRSGKVGFGKVIITFGSGTLRLGGVR